MSRRKKTSYPGVFFRESNRIGGPGIEKVFYVLYKKNGKLCEEKIGRQFADGMTAARASYARGELIEGKRLSRKQRREQKRALKAAVDNKWTVDSLWKSYKTNKKIKGIVTDKNRYKNYIKPHFGDKEPQEIIPLDVDRLRLKLLKTKSPGTVKNVLELLRRILNYGTKKNLCKGLNFTIEMPKVDNVKTEDLTAIQLNNLLKAIKKDTHENAGHMMLMALYTGMRRGELFRLKWNHIHVERGFINLVDPKGGPSQTIPLNDAAREVLENHPRTGKSPFVFAGRGGRQMVDVSKAVNKIKTKAGLPAKFRPLHGLRHTFASILASSGKVDMYVLQKLLTHKGPAMTQRYAHLRDETLKKASNLAGSIIDETVNGKKEKVVNLEDH